MKRFTSKFTKNNNGCWEWNAGCFSDGYGAFSYQRKTQKAHRISYLLFVGMIPKGKMVLHRCDNPPCVNPAHLFIGTAKDNAHDAIQKGRHRGDENVAIPKRRKKACPRGHLYSGNNLRLERRSDGGVARVCRKCQNERHKKYYHGKREG